MGRIYDRQEPQTLLKEDYFYVQLDRDNSMPA
jgi:hypothetical protein